MTIAPLVACCLWAGVLPLRLEPQEPQTEERVPEGVSVPQYVRHHRLAKHRD